MNAWIDDGDLPQQFFDHRWERISVDGGTYFHARPLFAPDSWRAEPLSMRIEFRHAPPSDVRIGDLVRLDKDRIVIELRRPCVATALIAADGGAA